MSDTVRMDMPKAAERPGRRLEVFTGAGRRRNWPPEAKAGIVAESYGDGDTVCAVARRHGLTPSQLFAWRREARRSFEAEGGPAEPLFVPAIVEAASLSPQSPRWRARSVRKPDRLPSGIIEVAIGGVTMRIGRGAETKTVAAVIRALKADA